jgi:crossover junction endodeoxyribonuclease RusA
MTLRFTVYGEPKSSGNKRISVHGGRAHIYESTKGAATWRDSVVYAARKEMLALQCEIDAYGPSLWPLTGPLSLTVVFTLARPKRTPKTRLWPDRKPDLSKLIRSTEDALKDAGLIKDDALFVQYELWKVFPKPFGFPRDYYEILKGAVLDAPGAFIQVASL